MSVFHNGCSETTLQYDNQQHERCILIHTALLFLFSFFCVGLLHKTPVSPVIFYELPTTKVLTFQLGVWGVFCATNFATKCGKSAVLGCVILRVKSIETHRFCTTN
mgnify:CR=1 FL=1